VIGGNILDVFLAKNNSPVTRALGIDPLRQETAINSSFGVTLKPFEGFTATIDGYTANIKDRIVLTGTFYDDDEQIGDILRSVGVSGAQFFANALDTKTIGLDVILTYGRRFGNHRIGATFAGNFNKMELGDLNLPTKLDGKEDAFFGEREKKFLLASAPPSKLALTLDYYLKRFNANVRIIRFDKVVLRDWIDTDDTYNAKFTTDLTLGYDITNNLSFVVGASNLLNVYPDIQDTETESGGNYDAVQMGSNGTFVFTKLGFKF
jgi:iron complex outermembrane receptor protein